MKAPEEFDEKRLFPLIKAKDWRACRRVCEEALAAGSRAFQYRALRASLKLKAGDAAGGWDDLMESFRLSAEYGAVYAEGEDEGARSRETFPLSGLSFAELERELSRAVKRSPRLACAWAWRGLARRRLFRYDGAAADLSRALELGMDTALVLSARGEARLQCGDLDGLEDLEAAARRPCAGWNHAWLGRALVAFRRDPRALEVLSRAIVLEPANGWHYAWRAEAKRILRLKDGLYDDYAQALRLDGAMRHSGFVRAWRGLALLEDGRPREALSDFEAALKRMPGYALAVNGKARSLRGLRRLGPWLEWLDRAAALDQKYVYNQLGMPAERAKGLAGDAAAAARRRPSDARAWRWLGFYLSLAGEADRAEDALTRALALRPRDAWALAWRGQLRAQAGRPGAEADLRKAAALSKSLVGPRAWLAKLEVAAGRPREALRHLDAALASDQRFVWAYADRGRVRLMLGDARGAAADLRAAAAKNPGFADAWADLAEALKRSGDAAGSRRAGAEALRLAPERAKERAAGWKAYFSAKG